MILWLFGDSIFHGAICETRKLKPRDALWRVRAPAEMIDLMLGEPFARLGGLTGIPVEVDEAAARIRAMVGREIGTADAIAMLDVGVHSHDPDLHERQWLQLRGAAAAHPGPTLICEGFEYGAQGRRRLVHSKPIGARSPNDAVRAAATAPMDQAGRTVFVPTFKPLLRYHHHLARELGSGIFWRDGVHMHAWGQARLCWLILEALGRADGAARERWRAFAAAAWSELGAPDPATAAGIAALACEPSSSLYAAGAAAAGGR